ncbi:hypothetical protein PSP20601_02355 [Pandoraea sputorum]|uniref:Uncharacterized protein n=2 Tax=Pandoraea sputorum TaxID=93222 RepID=A0A239SLN1_9BURK|nr:Uncharacterised protein [Pandoraea sputorum]VVE05196.1 hypothetical protein PSP20601_02355 [Pandoraea sputorum]
MLRCRPKGWGLSESVILIRLRVRDTLQTDIRYKINERRFVVTRPIDECIHVMLSTAIMPPITVAFAPFRSSLTTSIRSVLKRSVPFMRASGASVLIGVLSCAHSVQAATSDERARFEAPVKAVADQRIAVDTPHGSALLPVYADHPLNQPVPDVTRVFIVMHGTLRNADVYYASGLQVVEKSAEARKDTMVVAPQFLTSADTRAFSLPPSTLAWSQEGWKGGEPARKPGPISSFEALDALLAHFADRRLYPSLSTVVMMGHSAGAQLLQRYAVTGREGDALARAGIVVRYVVANPSSYLYFDDERPNAQAIADGTCPRATQWKYGLKSAPPYVASQDVRNLEAHYVARDVVYLLGQADTNPYTHFIDRSCAGMAQGPYRLARGLAYFAYLKKRHPEGLAQQVVEVPGVGHDGLGMFTSACGLAVLFGRALPTSCPVISGTATPAPGAAQ